MQEERAKSHGKADPSKFTMETVKSQWLGKMHSKFQKVMAARLRLLYPMKLSIKAERETNPFYCKNRLKEYITRKSALRKILEGLLQTEEKDKYPKEETGENTQY